MDEDLQYETLNSFNPPTQMVALIGILDQTLTLWEGDVKTMASIFEEFIKN